MTIRTKVLNVIFLLDSNSVLFSYRMFEATESPMLVEATTEFQDQMYNILACDILALPSGKISCFITL